MIKPYPFQCLSQIIRTPSQSGLQLSYLQLLADHPSPEHHHPLALLPHLLLTLPQLALQQVNIFILLSPQSLHLRSSPIEVLDETLMLIRIMKGCPSY